MQLPLKWGASYLVSVLSNISERKKQVPYEAWRVAIINPDAESDHFKLLIHAPIKDYNGFSDKFFCAPRQL